jgi:4-hydroxybenzoate polyprenyltransferase
VIKIPRLAFDIFDIVNDLRLHVLFSYFLIFSWFLYSSGVGVERSVESALFATCIAGVGYLLNRYTDYPYDIIVDAGLKKAQRSTYLYLTFFFLFLCMLFVYKNLSYVQPAILGLIFGLSYSLKTVFKYPLKNYFLVKNLSAVAFKYVFMIIFIPFSTQLLIHSISVIIFLFIYEVLWDVRDIESDKAGGVSTLPIVIGKEWALFVCGMLCIASYFSQYFFVNHTDYFFIKYIVAMLFIIALFAINNVGVRWYHVGIYIHILLRLLFINHEILDYIEGALLSVGSTQGAQSEYFALGDWIGESPKTYSESGWSTCA